MELAVAMGRRGGTASVPAQRVIARHLLGREEFGRFDVGLQMLAAITRLHRCGLGELRVEFSGQ